MMKNVNFIAMDQFDASNDELIQKALQKRRATIKRILILSFMALAIIVVRVKIKNPPPPPKPNHANVPIKILPGMLARMPASERAKLSPEMLVKFQQADQNALEKKREQPAEAIVNKDVVPPPTEIATVHDAVQTVSHRRIKRPKVFEPEVDSAKTALVLFNSGRHIKAYNASRKGMGVEIRLDRTITAQIPRNLVMSISNNALSWKEPVPKGYRELKPAKGITIQVLSKTAERITVDEDENSI